MSKYILTIAVPTYNSHIYIKRLIESLIKQEIANVEIIFVDDCSVDNTLEIIKSYSEKLKFKIYENSENYGLDKNVINCFKKANGEFVWILGHDDFLEGGAVRKVLEIIQKSDNLGGIFLNYSIFDNKNKVIVRESWVKDIQTSLNLSGDEFWFKLGVAPSLISSMIHNKSAVLATNYLKYIGSNWLDFAISLEYAVKYNMSILSEVYLVGAGDSSETPWNENGKAITSNLDLLEIVIANSGKYRKNTVESIKKSIFYLLHRKGISAKANGLRLTKKLMERLESNLGDQPGFILFSILLRVPGPVYKFLMKIYHIKYAKYLYWYLKKT